MDISIVIRDQINDDGSSKAIKLILRRQHNGPIGDGEAAFRKETAHFGSGPLGYPTTRRSSETGPAGCWSSMLFS